MGLVYIYLATWILGGVLLGSSMLLAQPSEAGASEFPTALEVAPSARTSALYPAAMALIGFGLGGLLAEGLGQVTDSWTCACAALAATLLGTAGFLTRTPKQV